MRTTLALALRLPLWAVLFAAAACDHASSPPERQGLLLVDRGYELGGTANPDGSGFRPAAWGGVKGRWLGGRDRVALHYVDPCTRCTPTSHVYAGSAAGTLSHVVPPGTPVQQELGVAATADGTWVFFLGFTGDSVAFWRAHPDGSELSRIGGYRAPNDGLELEDATPDGRRLLFTAAVNGSFRLFTLDTQTAAVTPLPVGGFYGRFSPDGSSMAYVRVAQPSGLSTVYVAAADGTGEHAVFQHQPVSELDHVNAIAWSPDGRTLLASRWTFGVMRVDLAAGTAAKLAGTDSMTVLDWTK